MPTWSQLETVIEKLATLELRSDFALELLMCWWAQNYNEILRIDPDLEDPISRILRLGYGENVVDPMCPPGKLYIFSSPRDSGPFQAKVMMPFGSKQLTKWQIIRGWINGENRK